MAKDAWKVTLCFAAMAGLLAYFYPLSVGDAAFGLLYPAYLHAASVLRFGKAKSHYQSLGKDQFVGTPSFRVYMMVFQVATVLVPFACVCLPMVPTRQKQVTATPLILLLLQVATEKQSANWHDVTRVLVPIGFNAYRLRSLATWIQVAQEDYGNDNTTTAASILFLTVAVVNLILWTYNLFIFLLWRVLPLYFDKQDSPDVPAGGLTWKANLVPVLVKNETNKTR